MRITIGSDSFDIVPLDEANLVSRAAIYTIWTHDPIQDNYPLLYVGESGEVEVRLTSSHHKYNCWIKNVIDGLYVGIRSMPSFLYAKEQRKAEERGLIKGYKPICND